MGRRKNKSMNKQLLPKFHITGEKGWINDPNGLVVFQGEYHAFFQYYPHDVKWGPMHWGHVKSRDLITWETLPVALRPDEQDGGCFSGSAIVWQEKLWLMYTSFNENEGGESIRQLQALASSADGVTFEKHGIVIGEEDLPSEYCPWDFRDPSVFRRGDTFYCVTAARKRGAGGRLLLFSSPDLFRWTFCCDLFDRDCDGSMTECPSWSDELNLLLFSEQFRPHEGGKYCNVHSCLYQFGTLENAGFVPSAEEDILDYGFDIYATQIFSGAPVMMGWLSMWDRSDPLAKFGFAGQLTLPRVLSVKNGKLRQKPVYRAEEVRKEENVSSLFDTLVTGAIKVEAENLSAFSIKLRKKGNSFASFALVENEWIFDRSQAGEKIEGVEKDEDSLAGIRRMPKENTQKTEIEIVSDKYSLEIFVNGISLTSVVCPEEDADGVELSLTAEKSTYTKCLVK